MATNSYDGLKRQVLTAEGIDAGGWSNSEKSNL